MLSRSAERLYWLARNMERTENTARLSNVYMNLMFDLPLGVEMSWGYLLIISGSESQFYKHYKIPNELNTMRFLLTDTSNPSSLYSSLCAARENMRITRDMIPDEAWQQINEIYLYAKNNLASISQRRGRVLFLQEILKGCQRFTGFLAGAMSHDDAYQFIRLGRNLERADMTTRILDIGPMLLSETSSHKMDDFESSLWINILKSLSALFMYRKHRRLRIKGGDVLDYVLKDRKLPRSVSHCLYEIQCCLDELPESTALKENLQKFEDQLVKVEVQEFTLPQLHGLLDTIQVQLGGVHNQISASWFLPRTPA